MTRLPLQAERLIELALLEDIGTGDVTSQACVPQEKEACATLLAKDELVLCGLDVARFVFTRLDPQCRFEALAQEGRLLAPGETIARVSGQARALLAAERTALNFLQHLCGIATLTRLYAQEIAHTRALVVDTRKTQPGQRALEKYAVRTGGGKNHRAGLSDGVLIKENHIRAAGGIRAAVAACRAQAAHTLAIEVEVTNLLELEEALSCQAEIVMLDNFPLDLVRQAVAQVAGRAKIEVSGNLSLQTIRAMAECGVDFCSVGRLTHSAPAADISLLFSREEASEPR